MEEIKYLFCLYELMKLILFNKETLVFSFQEMFNSRIAKLFKQNYYKIKFIPIWMVKKFFKRKLFKLILGFADTIIVNSNEFKKNLKNNLV